MVDRLRVHALDETELIGDLGGVRQKIAHPRAALAVLLERFDRREHQLPLRVARHRAEAFPRQIFIGNRRPMQLLQFRLVIEQIDMRRRAIHEQINHPLRLRRKMRRDRLRKTIATQQRRQRRTADAARGPSKKLPPRNQPLMFEQWVHDYSLVNVSSKFNSASENAA